MMTFQEMSKRIGKRRAVDVAVHSRAKGPTGFDRTRGIKGRIKFRTCRHGRWVIENYIAKECPDCTASSQTAEVFSVHYDPREYFNIGTGTYGTTSEHRKYARANGLVEAG